ncbi:hypothetical protein V8E51_000338 [Hyaloscypha variabilis]
MRSEENMISKFKTKAVTRKPLPDHSIPRAHSPNPPSSGSGRINGNHASSQLDSIAFLPPRVPDPRSSNPSHTAADSSQMSLQEYQRQHGRQQDLEDELFPDTIPQQLEGSQTDSILPRLSIPQAAPYSEHRDQPPAPVIIVPPAELPHSYFIMDTDTGMACYPTVETHPISRPLYPPTVSSSFDLLGVPVITSSNPADRAKGVIMQRYEQEFRGMIDMGKEMIGRLVELDLERERRRFEGLVWRGAGDEELKGFAEWLMRGEE